VRDALTRVGDEVDVTSAAAVWERALAAPVWDRTPVWVHGDLHGGNLLVRDGRLSGVIDFGGLGVGDSAVDVMPAWTFFTSDGRDAFRAELEVDDATWNRGRGWALSMGLIALPYYRTTNPTLAASARRWIQEALSDRSR
jgi:aminoglycoside phosphotransferase (APT) family kinase protein